MPHDGKWRKVNLGKDNRETASAKAGQCEELADKETEGR
jgi:hypothetical protein